MIKATELFRKRPDMSVEAFHDYWLNGHSKVVLALDGVVRYVQNHPVRTPESAALPFDGVVEIWFESLEVMRRNGEQPYWREVVADEARFIDRSTLRLVMGDEHVLFDGAVPERAAKTIRTLDRRRDLTPEAFQEAGRQTLGASAARVPGLMRYALTLPRLAGYRTGKAIACDGLAMAWFGAAPEGNGLESTALATAEAALADHMTPAVLVREHVIKAG